MKSYFTVNVENHTHSTSGLRDSTSTARFIQIYPPSLIKTNIIMLAPTAVASGVVEREHKKTAFPKYFVRECHFISSNTLRTRGESVTLAFP